MTDTTAREPHLNVADLAWVPVTTSDGNHETWTLRRVLSGARHAKALDCSSPIEQMALMRTLVAFMALVCREAGVTDILNTADDLDDGTLAAATDAVLERHRDTLFLDHSTKPFFQEWRRDWEEWDIGTAKDVDEKLRPETPPKDTSKLWWRRDRSRVDSALPAEDVVPLLLTYWFGSLGSPKATLNSDIGTSSNRSLGVRVGNDAQFYWKHVDNLLSTLLANLLLSWVIEPHLPSFLDRTRAAPCLASGSPSALWSSTYSHNACLLTWDGASDSPTGVCTGISRWGFSGLRTTKQTQTDKGADEKQATSLRERDFARFYSTGTTGKKENLSKFDPGAATLVRLHDWYSTLGAGYVSKKIEDRVLWGDVSSGDWVMDVFVTKVGMKGMVSSFESAHWFGFDPSAYDLDSETWETINELYESVVDNGRTDKQRRNGILGALRYELEKPDGPARSPKEGNQSKAMRKSLSVRAEHLFWSRCNKVISNFINAVSRGDDADAMSVLQAMRDAAIDIYDIVTTPLHSTDRMFNIENSRASLLSALFHIAPAPKEDIA
ncbi:MAG: type I-E CRISPR-associated protein Cse1/CasA [Micrococcales bacterium]|nr:type I-E CRISPR-associated protein Cse1/CasA [Micrococcales bacterium]